MSDWQLTGRVQQKFEYDVTYQVEEERTTYIWTRVHIFDTCPLAVPVTLVEQRWRRMEPGDEYELKQLWAKE